MLRSVIDYSLEKKYGTLLESAYLFDRALRVRLWETSSSNIFYQCKELTQKTMDTLKANDMNSINSLQGYSLQQIISLLHCSYQEARSLLVFTKQILVERLILLVSFEEDHIHIKVKPELTLEIPQDTSGVNFHLICFNQMNHNLIGHRKIKNSGNQNIEFIFLLNNSKESEIKVSLLGNIFGLDAFFVNSLNKSDPYQHIDKNNFNDSLKSSLPTSTPSFLDANHGLQTISTKSEKKRGEAKRITKSILPEKNKKLVDINNSFEKKVIEELPFSINFDQFAYQDDFDVPLEHSTYDKNKMTSYEMKPQSTHQKSSVTPSINQYYPLKRIQGIFSSQEPKRLRSTPSIDSQVHSLFFLK